MIDFKKSFLLFILFFLVAARFSNVRLPSSANLETSFDAIPVKTESEALSLRFAADKFYTLSSPNPEKLLGIYRKVLDSAKAQEKTLLKKRIKILESASLEYKKNPDGYKLAQHLLSEDPQDKAFAALAYLELYFKLKQDKASETAWVMRINLRKNLYINHSYYIMYYFIQLFPKSPNTSTYARNLREFLRDDYRPDSQDRDLPLYDVDKIMKELSRIL